MCRVSNYFRGGGGEDRISVQVYEIPLWLRNEHGWHVLCDERKICDNVNFYACNLSGRIWFVCLQL